MENSDGDNNYEEFHRRSLEISDSCSDAGFPAYEALRVQTLLYRIHDVIIITHFSLLDSSTQWFLFTGHWYFWHACEKDYVDDLGLGGSVEGIGGGLKK